MSDTEKGSPLAPHTWQKIDTMEKLLKDAADRVFTVNEINGWFEEGRTMGDNVALLHSEVSEALEAFRHHGLERWIVDEHGERWLLAGGGDRLHTGRELAAYPDRLKPEGVASEAADIFIRLLDFCYRYDINLATEFEAKLAYNKTRGHRHGGKAL